MHSAYLPKLVKIERSVKETPDIKTFYLRKICNFSPGQFLEISCLGKGEAPISIASSPDEDYLKISFRRIGNVTNGLFELKQKNTIGLRGPFGNGFPLEKLRTKKLLFIAGGIGIAPLRSLLKFLIISQPHRIGDIIFLYGARKPQDLLYKNELKHWNKSIKLMLTVDNPDREWHGRVGVVTKLLDEISIEPLKTIALICGPEIMMRFTTAKLIELGFLPSNIILSLERLMKCGVGKCGHCYIADKFVCTDGPVFSYEQLNSLNPSQIL